MSLDMFTFVRLADGWNDLGYAVQDQARSIFDVAAVEDCNPNAVSLIEKWLETVREEVPGSVLGDDAVDFLEVIRDASATANASAVASTNSAPPSQP